MSKAQPMMVWHYTTGEKARGIAEAGMIYPAAGCLTPGERPVTWFSLHQFFEPTATKGLLDPSTGRIRQATIAEMIDLCGGLFRYGIPIKGLLGGEALRHKAKIPHAMWKGLVRAGAIAGANSADWFSVIGPVDLARCTVQQLNPASNTWEAAVMDTFSEGVAE